jgi:hypothetical protein
MEEMRREWCGIRIECRGRPTLGKFRRVGQPRLGRSRNHASSIYGRSIWNNVPGRKVTDLVPPSVGILTLHPRLPDELPNEYCSCFGVAVPLVA